MYISKRVLIIVGVAAVILVGILVSVFAFVLLQSNSSSANANANTPTPVVTVTPKPGIRACALGIIQSIGVQSFVVSESKGQQIVTIGVNAKTTFHKRGISTPASFTDLAVGQQVRITSQGFCDKQAPTFIAKNVLILVPTGTPRPVASPTPTV